MSTGDTDADTFCAGLVVVLGWFLVILFIVALNTLT